MAYKKNLYIDQGSDFTFKTSLTNDADEDMDLTGFSVSGQIRKSYHSRTSYDFLVHISGSEIDFFLPATVSNQMEPGRYVYDIEVTDDKGAITRLVEGIVHINPSVTR